MVVLEGKRGMIERWGHWRKDIDRGRDGGRAVLRTDQVSLRRMCFSCRARICRKEMIMPHSRKEPMPPLYVSFMRLCARNTLSTIVNGLIAE